MSDKPVRPGVRLGVDVGKVRVGIAKTDPHGILATPLETVSREDFLSRIVSLAAEYNAIEVVVGRPLGLSGNPTPSTQDAEQAARDAAALIDIPVRLVDERLSTTQASAGLRESGHNSRTQRQIIDQAAAVIILQHSLESETRSGVAAGDVVPRPGGDL